MAQQKEELERNLKQQLTPDPNVGEKVLFTGLCVLSIVAPENKKVGAGMAQILQNISNHRYRLLVRDNHNLNSSLLNCYILEKIGSLNKSTYQFEAINYSNEIKKETFNIRLINDQSGEAFKNGYIQAVSSNQKLLK